MRLTTFADCSLRVLIHLGTHADQRAPVGDIAEAYRISKSHLMIEKILAHLRETIAEARPIWLPESQAPPQLALFD